MNEEDHLFLNKTVGSVTGKSKAFKYRRYKMASEEWWAISARRSGIDGDGKGGRRFERHFAEVLEYMKSHRYITDFIYHAPHSAEDHQGKDFTVRRMTVSGEHVYSFGITTSSASRRQSRKKHPNIPIIYFAPELTTDDLIGMIIQVWDDIDIDPSAHLS